MNSDQRNRKNVCCYPFWMNAHHIAQASDQIPSLVESFTGCQPETSVTNQKQSFCSHRISSGDQKLPLGRSSITSADETQRLFLPCMSSRDQKRTNSFSRTAASKTRPFLQQCTSSGDQDRQTTFSWTISGGIHDGSLLDLHLLVTRSDASALLNHLDWEDSTTPCSWYVFWSPEAMKQFFVNHLDWEDSTTPSSG